MTRRPTCSSTRGSAGAWSRDVVVDVEDGVITAVTLRDRSSSPDREPRPLQPDHVLLGLTIPGLANCHSHAFHRALRGRTQREPRHVLDVARPDVRRRRAARPGLLLRAGAGDVPRDGGRGHHLPSGSSTTSTTSRTARRTTIPTPWATPCSRRPARPGSGSRCSTRSTCPAASVSPRRACRCATATAVGAGLGRPGRRDGRRRARRSVGAALHSVRALPEDALDRPRALAAWPPVGPPRAPLRAGRRERRLPGGVRRHPDPTARRPRAPPADHHGRARDPPDRGRHRAHRRGAGLRRLLPDHRARPRRRRRSRAGALADAGARLTLGSDSHAVIDLFEEMRAVELDERLVTRRRGHWSGRRAARRPPPRPGTPASAGTTRARSPSASAPTSSPSTRPVAAHRRHRRRRARGRLRRERRRRHPAMVDGRIVFRQGDRDQVGEMAQRSVGRSSAASAIAKVSAPRDEHPRHRHRRAGHERPAHQRPDDHRDPTGLLGLVDDAAVVRRGQHHRVGRPGGRAHPPPTRRTTPVGAPSMPGYVDSHSHLVFAGDRAQEFAARMTRDALLRRRHPHHRRGHPRGHRRTAHLARRPARRRDAGPGHHHHRDQEWLRTLRPRRGAVARRGPPVHRRDDLPRCPRRAERHHPRRTTSSWSPARCWRPRRPHARWIDVFCEDGAFDVDQARSDPGSGHRQRPARPAARQPADLRRRRPAGRRARAGRGRPLHLPVRRRRQRARRLRHHRDAAAGRRVLDPAPVPRRPPAPRRRRAGRAGQRLQPGLLLHLLDGASASRWPSATCG